MLCVVVWRRDVCVVDGDCCRGVWLVVVCWRCALWMFVVVCCCCALLLFVVRCRCVLLCVVDMVKVVGWCFFVVCGVVWLVVRCCRCALCVFLVVVCPCVLLFVLFVVAFFCR